MALPGANIPIPTYQEYENLKTQVTEHMEQFVQNLNGNGYQKLPNGLILQWRNVPANTLTTAGGGNLGITFPITFPNACLGTWANLVPSGHDDTYEIKGSGVGDNSHMAVVTNTPLALFPRSIFAMAIGW